MSEPTWTAKMFDENKALKAKVKELEEWQERMRDAFSLAVQMDLEHGVQWMNEEASAEFAKRYPKLCDALSLLEQEETL